MYKFNDCQHGNFWIRKWKKKISKNCKFFFIFLAFQRLHVHEWDRLGRKRRFATFLQRWLPNHDLLVFRLDDHRRNYRWNGSDPWNINRFKVKTVTILAHARQLCPLAPSPRRPVAPSPLGPLLSSLFLPSPPPSSSPPPTKCLTKSWIFVFANLPNLNNYW